MFRRGIALLMAGCLLGACKSAPEVPKPKPVAPQLRPPEPEHVEHLGGIIAQSHPSGLVVLIDGKKVGKTPVTVENVKPGWHEVKFIDAENGDVTHMVEVAEGQYPLVKHAVIPKATDAEHPD